MKSLQQDLRHRIETAFEHWARFTLRYHWWIIAAMVLFTGFLAWSIQGIRVEANTESFLRHSDPARIAYNEFREEFGTDEVIVIVLKSDDLFDVKFLQRLRALHYDIEDNLPYVADMNSLVTARVTHGTEDSLITDDLMEEWPRDVEAPEPAVLEKIRSEALSNPIYKNLLISQDQHYTTIMIFLEPGEAVVDEATALAAEEHDSVGHVEETNVLLDSDEINEIAIKLEEIVKRHQSEDFPIWTAGVPPMTYEIIGSMQRDMSLCTAIALVGMALLLFFLFRRGIGVFLPLLTVGLPLLGTFGIMQLSGIPISPATQIMPSFLLAAGVGDSVHILSVFLSAIDSGKTREEALIYALGHSGLAVLMTSVTTAGSLVSFAFVDLAPLAGFGIAAPVGVMLALIYSIVLLPALLCVVPVKSDRAHLAPESTATDAFLAKVGDISTRHPWRVVAVWTLLFATFFFGAAQLRMTHNSTKWFKAGHPLRNAMEIASDHFSNSMSIEMIVDTGEENGLHDPAVMNAIEELKLYAQDLQVGEVHVGKALAVTDVLKETHQALNADDPAFYTIPQDRVTIAQELLLFESSGSDDLDDLVTSQFDKARITLTVPFCDATHYVAFQTEVEKKAKEIFGDLATVKVTGHVSLMARTIEAMLSSMLQSYVMALLIITPLMVMLVGDLRIGLLSMFPNIAPIVLGLGLMYYLDIPLDMFTMLIGSIAIGVVVDDTIHFLHNFKRYYDQGDSPAVATHKTLMTAGRALLFTCVVLTLGFSVFLGASLQNIVNFGIITGFVICVGFIADVTLTPAFATLAVRNRKRLTQADAPSEK